LAPEKKVRYAYFSPEKALVSALKNVWESKALNVLCLERKTWCPCTLTLPEHFYDGKTDRQSDDSFKYIERRKSAREGGREGGVGVTGTLSHGDPAAATEPEYSIRLH
jgi:hypothetical protein